MKQITLTQLEYIAAVAEHGHFGRAAAACCVTQPTLSMQIQKAEQQLGVAVFDRSRSPVVPTEIGLRLVAQARVTLREAARLFELCEDASETVAGMLRVGILPTLGPYLLPQLVGALAERYPALQLNIEELMTAAILDRLRNETLDIGLIATPEISPDVRQWPLFTEPLVGYVGSEHPLAGRERLHLPGIPRQDLWLLSEAHCLGQQTREICRLAGDSSAECQSLAQQMRLESGSLEMLRQMVALNGGITLLPALCVAAMPLSEGAQVIPFVAPQPSREISLVARRAYVKQQVVEAFVNTLLDSLPAEIAASASRPWRVG